MNKISQKIIRSAACKKSYTFETCTYVSISTDLRMRRSKETQKKKTEREEVIGGIEEEWIDNKYIDDDSWLRFVWQLLAREIDIKPEHIDGFTQQLSFGDKPLAMIIYAVRSVRLSSIYVPVRYCQVHTTILPGRAVCYRELLRTIRRKRCTVDVCWCPPLLLAILLLISTATIQ